MRGLLVVAHPDDEVIFAGSLLLETRDCWDWMAVCASYGGHRRDERSERMHRVLDALEIRDRDFIGLDEDAINAEVIAESLDRAITFDPDFVFTHNADGDYLVEPLGHRHHGHPHHVAVHQAVIRVFGYDVFEFDSGLATKHSNGPVTRVPIHEDKPRLLRFYWRELEAINRDQPKLAEYAWSGRDGCEQFVNYTGRVLSL